jgi:carbon starvation protein
MNFTGPGGNPEPAWKAIWPVFGATNQLLAALVLTVVFVFVRRAGRALRLAVLVPAFFMIAMTMAALYQLLARNIALHLWNAVTFIAAALFLLSFSFLVEVSRVIFRERKEA